MPIRICPRSSANKVPNPASALLQPYSNLCIQVPIIGASAGHSHTLFLGSTGEVTHSAMARLVLRVRAMVSVRVNGRHRVRERCMLRARLRVRVRAGS